MAKLCKDCKHCKSPANSYSTCLRLGTTKHLVSGVDLHPLSAYCIEQRYANWLESRILGYCGTDGRYWEPRNG